MFSEDDLIRKFESLERLFSGAKTEGEKEAASQALLRIKDRLRKFELEDPPVEYKFTLSNVWSRRLLSALLRRYEIKPYRYHRQRRTTVMAKVSEVFVDEVLWPEFQQFNKLLLEHINSIAENVISKAINEDSSEATEISERLLN